MPGVDRPVNRPLSPNECVASALHQIDRLIAEGLEEVVALKYVAHVNEVDYAKLLTLYLDREFAAHGLETSSYGE